MILRCTTSIYSKKPGTKTTTDLYVPMNCGERELTTTIHSSISLSLVLAMTRSQRNRRTLIATFLTLIVGVSAAAQTQPRTVTEFYLALPGGIYGIEGTQDSDTPGFENDFFFYANERNESRAAIRTYRRSLIKTADIKNGYLRL